MQIVHSCSFSSSEKIYLGGGVVPSDIQVWQGRSFEFTGGGGFQTTAPSRSAHGTYSTCTYSIWVLRVIYMVAEPRVS